MLSEGERFTGQKGLIERLKLSIPEPYQISIIGAKTRKSERTAHNHYQWFRSDDYADNGLGDLHFALRREPIDLSILAAAFRKRPRGFKQGIKKWVQAQPSSAFARRAWFLFEFLTDTVVSLPDSAPINYVPLLDNKLQVTLDPATRRSSRHRIDVNLIGTKDFCPLVRRTPEIDAIDPGAARQAIIDLMPDGDEDLFRRAVSYLYTKETRASYEIEAEKPAENKILRFVHALRETEDFDLSSKRSYIRIQNTIISNPNFHARAWRTEQVYIGETTVGFREKIYCIFPKPADVPQLMKGFRQSADAVLAQANPIVAAAVLSFGFVFIHPFPDGNGRLHRFLIHQALAKTNVTPDGIIFPISATMLRKRAEYDAALESFSKRIMPFIDWQRAAADDGSIIVLNETIDLYRYFDATDLCVYLNATILESIRVDLKEELDFINAFDAAFQRVDEYLDGMPHHRVRNLIRYILQNKGRLSQNKRAQFAELSTERIQTVEDLIAAATAPPPTDDEDA